MNKKVVKTFWANIYVGFYDRDLKKNIGSMVKTRKLCQEYVNDVHLCITLTPVEYIYVNGTEKGIKIGLINYPRFPEKNSQIKIYAVNLAEKLMLAFHQYKVTIIMPTETIMLSTEPEKK